VLTDCKQGVNRLLTVLTVQGVNRMLTELTVQGVNRVLTWC